MAHAPGVPAVINGQPVVGMVKLPPADGFLPHRHVVICENRSIARATDYTVWTVAWQQHGELPGEWVVTGSGRYELPTLDRALFTMCERASNYLGWQS
jgi:hypothetical protein